MVFSVLSRSAITPHFAAVVVQQIHLVHSSPSCPLSCSPGAPGRSPQVEGGVESQGTDLPHALVGLDDLLPSELTVKEDSPNTLPLLGVSCATHWEAVILTQGSVVGIREAFICSLSHKDPAVVLEFAFYNFVVILF